MADRPVYVSGASADTSSGTATVSYTVAAGDDRLLVGHGGSRQGRTFVSCTWDGDALTFVDEQDVASGDAGRRVGAWRMIAPAVKTADMVVDASSGSGITRTAVGAAGFTGVNQTNPLGAVAKSSGTSATSTTVSPTSNSDDLVIDALCIGAAPTAGENQTANFTATSTTIRLAGSRKDGAVTSTDMVWTFSSTVVAHLGFALKPTEVAAFDPAWAQGSNAVIGAGSPI